VVVDVFVYVVERRTEIILVSGQVARSTTTGSARDPTTYTYTSTSRGNPPRWRLIEELSTYQALAVGSQSRTDVQSGQGSGQALVDRSAERSTGVVNPKNRSAER
jgi:hypothetical protein